MKTATTEEGLVYNFTYDTYGNNTSVSVTGNGVTMTSTATYSSDGNRLEKTTDALGKETKYGYNAQTNVLEWVQYPEDTDGTDGTADTRTKYTYDELYRMATAACATDTGKNLSAAYTYTDDYLTAIQTPSTTYRFNYGDFGLRTSVRVGNRTLAAYSYTEEAAWGEEDDRRYDLDRLDYGNGDSVEYTYDDKGRLVTQTYEDGDYLYHKYNNNGDLASVWDSATDVTTRYYYDLTDRMMKYTESGKNYSHSVGYQYDTQNNLTQLVENIDGVEKATSYTYDDDNRVTSVTTDGTTVSYAYDGFGRGTTQTTSSGDTVVLTESFTYVPNSTQIATYTTTAGSYSVTYAYTYDDNGNILTISDGAGTVTYTYDSANQLLSEDNPAHEYEYEWSYDSAGNVLGFTQYFYIDDGEDIVSIVADSQTYAYGDGDWGDLLVKSAADVETDAIGNILTHQKPCGSYTCTWEHG